MGKIAVLVAFESAADKAKLEEMGKQIAMHIATARSKGSETPKPDPEFKTLSKYSDMDEKTFFETAKKVLSDKGNGIGLIQFIDLVGTLFNFDNSKESKKVKLVNLVLDTDFKGPNWFERVFKGM